MARRSLLILTALGFAMLSVPMCLAQRHGGFGGAGHAAGEFRNGRNSSQFLDRRGFDHGRGDFAGAYLWGDPFFWYGDNTMPQPAPEGGPPVMILRPDTAPEAKLTPLLIELEGDRYVRRGATVQAAPGEASREPRTIQAPESDSSSDGRSAQLAPTTLIFRDGHREQIPDYAIVGRVLYAHCDFDGEPGYGLKNIQVSELDIPATIKANRENGVSFVLPSGPNEVVTRP